MNKRRHNSVRRVTVGILFISRSQAQRADNGDNAVVIYSSIDRTVLASPQSGK